MFHDNIRAERFSQVKLPKLKGHVKVELKNVETGKIKIAYEGDNMITNALQDIFDSNYCGALAYRKCLPLYSKMLGGVLLFGTAQDVSSGTAADDYFIPDNSANTVIAHAGQTTFSSQADDITRGSPLDTSMHIADGAVTLAWFWGPSAGNGTIRSVSLTHADVGDAGTGSTSQAFGAMNPVINAAINPDNTAYCLPFTHASNEIDNMPLFVASDGYGYRFKALTTSVKVYKLPMVYSQTGLIEEPFKDTDIEEHTINTTTNFNNYQPDYFFDESGYLYLLYNSSASHTVDVEKIKLSDFTTTHYSWTDLGSGSITVGPLRNSNYPIEAIYSNGFVYLRSGINAYNVNGVLKVQVSSIANQSFLERTTNVMGGCFRPSSTGKILVGKKAVINNGVLYNGVNSAPDDFWSNMGQSPIMCSKTGLANLAMQYLKGGTGIYYVAISKFYLATKFNLPEPVVKQNNQSMTVTYTLTEV